VGHRPGAAATEKVELTPIPAQEDLQCLRIPSEVKKSF
jgi:hypothetical protein